MASLPPDGPPPAPQFTPREELEARLTALVLGEAGDFEAATLRAHIADDAELAALYHRLEAAAGTLKKTLRDPAASAGEAAAAPAHLSPERRVAIEKLFAPEGINSKSELRITNAETPDSALHTPPSTLHTSKSKRRPTIIPWNRPIFQIRWNRPLVQVLAAAACLLFIPLAIYGLNFLQGTLKMSRTLSVGKNSYAVASASSEPAKDADYYESVNPAYNPAQPSAVAQRAELGWDNTGPDKDQAVANAPLATVVNNEPNVPGDWIMTPPTPPPPNSAQGAAKTRVLSANDLVASLSSNPAPASGAMGDAVFNFNGGNTGANANKLLVNGDFSLGTSNYKSFSPPMEAVAANAPSAAPVVVSGAGFDLDFTEPATAAAASATSAPPDLPLVNRSEAVDQSISFIRAGPVPTGTTTVTTVSPDSVTATAAMTRPLSTGIPMVATVPIEQAAAPMPIPPPPQAVAADYFTTTTAAANTATGMTTVTTSALSTPIVPTAAAVLALSPVVAAPPPPPPPPTLATPSARGSTPITARGAVAAGTGGRRGAPVGTGGIPGRGAAGAAGASGNSAVAAAPGASGRRSAGTAPARGVPGAVASATSGRRGAAPTAPGAAALGLIVAPNSLISTPTSPDGQLGVAPLPSGTTTLPALIANAAPAPGQGTANTTASALGTGTIILTEGTLDFASSGPAVLAGGGAQWEGNLTDKGLVAGTAGGGMTGSGSFVLDTDGGTSLGGNGTLVLGNLQGLYQNPTVVTTPGDTVDRDYGVSNFGQLNNATLGGLSGNQNITNSNGSQTSPVASNDDGTGSVALAVGGNDRVATYSGIISGAGSLSQNANDTSKLDNGEWILAGNSTYRGGTTVTGGGTLFVTGASDYESQYVFNGKKVTNDAVEITGGNISGSSKFDGLVTAMTPGADVVASGGRDNVPLNAKGTYSGNISGSGSFIKNGTGIVTLSDANSFTGGVVVTAGTMSFGNGISEPTVGAAVTGGSLYKVGNGTLVLNGTSTAPTSFVKSGAGTLQFGNYSGTTTEHFGANLSAQTIDDANLIFDNGITTGTTSDARPASNVAYNDGTLNYVTGNASDSLFTSRASGDKVSPNAANEKALANTLTISGVGSGSSVGNETVDRTVTIGGFGNVIKTGSGNLTLSGNNTFNGTVTLTSGTLQLGNGSTAGASSPVEAEARFLDVQQGQLQGVGQKWNLISQYTNNPAPTPAAGASDISTLGAPFPVAQAAAKKITGTTQPARAAAPKANIDAKDTVGTGTFTITTGTKPVDNLTATQPMARPPSDVKFPAAVATADNAFSTFALNVNDASYRVALAALQSHKWPDPAGTRTEEFLNAFQYHDPAPGPGEACAVNYDLGQNPFESGGDLLRVSFQTAAAGRDRATPLRLTILLDGSGSMTRADRVATLQAAMRTLGRQLRAGDTVSLVTFARTAQVRAFAIPAERFGEIEKIIADLLPDGGTNMEDALKTAYQVARQNFDLNAQNRVILLTDGAANLGELEPAALAGIVEQNRKAGIALDAYGVGWDGYNDAVLEALTRKSDGRYGFLNRPEDVDAAFARKLAGALTPAAQDVKLQIQFNPARVESYRLMGYNNLRLTKEQFRDNTVSAGELAAADQGTALYNLVLNPNGRGPIATVRARYRDPGTDNYHELSWTVQYTGLPPAFDRAAPALRLAATAGYFAEYLQQSPFAAEVKPRALLQTLRGVPESFAPDSRPADLAQAIQAASSLSGD